MIWFNFCKMLWQRTMQNMFWRVILLTSTDTFNLGLTQEQKKKKKKKKKRRNFYIWNCSSSSYKFLTLEKHGKLIDTDWVIHSVIIGRMYWYATVLHAMLNISHCLHCTRNLTHISTKNGKPPEKNPRASPETDLWVYDNPYTPIVLKKKKNK